MTSFEVPSEIPAGAVFPVECIEFDIPVGYQGQFRHVGRGRVQLTTYRRTSTSIRVRATQRLVDGTWTNQVETITIDLGDVAAGKATVTRWDAMYGA